MIHFGVRDPLLPLKMQSRSLGTPDLEGAAEGDTMVLGNPKGVVSREEKESRGSSEDYGRRREAML